MGNLLSGLVVIFLITGCSSVERSTASVPIVKSDGLRWPLHSTKINRGFNSSKFNYHDGIDLHARRGTPIMAAADGKVVYAGNAFHGYGKMILIEHHQGLATLYGHCQKIFVRTGDYVDQGQKIALVGQTGRASAPHLHFEVRYHKKPVNPLEFLP